MDDEDIDTPPEIIHTANTVTSDLLSQKSKKLYMNTYKEFLNWCTGKKVKNYTENVFIAYFSEKSSSCKASTLWANYSMLKATFNLNKNIDISKFTRLSTFLKRTAKNYRPKKSNTFTLEDIEKFIYEAPDNQFLMMKVVAIFGISGACRRHELSQILTDDIQDAGSVLTVTIRDSKNKTVRTFYVVDNKEKSPSFLQIYRKYYSLRPRETDHKRFFVFYRNSNCTKQPAGINYFGKIPSLIATFLNLPNPDNYTGHCFRKSSADISALKRHRGRKSCTVAQSNQTSSNDTIETQQLQQASTSQCTLSIKEENQNQNIVITNIHN